jgi:hypothetical protein
VPEALFRGGRCKNPAAFQQSRKTVVASEPLQGHHSGMTASKITIREDFPAAPICPHCGKEIQEIAARRLESVFGVRFLYYCCDCRKVLGVSHRKGFWMG